MKRFLQACSLLCILSFLIRLSTFLKAYHHHYAVQNYRFYINQLILIWLIPAIILFVISLFFRRK